MRRDLHHGIAGSIDDQLASVHLTLAIVVNNLRAGVWFIDDYWAARVLLDLFDNLFWKAIRKRRQLFFNRQAHHFPVTVHTVFTGGNLIHTAIPSQRLISGGDAFDWLHAQIAQTQLSQVRQL